MPRADPEAQQSAPGADEQTTFKPAFEGVSKYSKSTPRPRLPPISRRAHFLRWIFVGTIGLIAAGIAVAWIQESQSAEADLQARKAKQEAAYRLARKAEEAAAQNTLKEARDSRWREQRGATLKEIKLLIASGKWEAANDLAREWDSHDDPELKPLAAMARTGAIRVRIEADRKARIAEERADRERRRREGVLIGMTSQDVLLSNWGHPEQVNRTSTNYGVREQWVYGGRSYLYFEDGKLTAIQN